MRNIVLFSLLLIASICGATFLQGTSITRAAYGLPTPPPTTPAHAATAAEFLIPPDASNVLGATFGDLLSANQ